MQKPIAPIIPITDYLPTCTLWSVATKVPCLRRGI